MPLLEDYAMVNDVPRFEMNEYITNDTDHIVQKSMVDRFISEDPISCPVLTYKIEKVINSNDSVEIVPDDYDKIFQLNTTNGTITINNFKKVIDTWQIFISASTITNSSGTTDWQNIELRIKEPYYPPNLKPYFTLALRDQAIQANETSIEEHTTTTKKKVKSDF